MAPLNHVTGGRRVKGRINLTAGLFGYPKPHVPRVMRAQVRRIGAITEPRGTMPVFPAEYQRASDHFYHYLQTLRDIALFDDSQPPYTITQAVFQVFRRRLSLSDAIRFAQVLPVGLRALFVADWDPDEPRRAFGSRDDMTRELLELRPEHNFSGDTSIADVAKALRLHVDGAAFDALLATFPEGAREFWAA